MLPQWREIPFWTVGWEIVLLLFTDHYVFILAPGGFGCDAHIISAFQLLRSTGCSLQGRLLAERSGGASATALLIIVKLQSCSEAANKHIMSYFVHYSTLVVYYLGLNSLPDWNSNGMEMHTLVCWADSHSRLGFFWVHLPVPAMSRTHFSLC